MSEPEERHCVWSDDDDRPLETLENEPTILNNLYKTQEISNETRLDKKLLQSLFGAEILRKPDPQA